MRKGNEEKNKRGAKKCKSSHATARKLVDHTSSAHCSSIFAGNKPDLQPHDCERPQGPREMVKKALAERTFIGQGCFR